VIRSAALSDKTFLARLIARRRSLFGVAFWNSLVIELDLRYPKQGDQEANDCSEKSCSTPEHRDLGNERATLTADGIAGNHISSATVNPASDRRTRDLQFWEEFPVPGFTDRLLDSVVVGPSRAESFHLKRIGRRISEGRGLGNTLRFQGVATATGGVRNVLRLSSAGLTGRSPRCRSSRRR
jgi:hypothetical protein